MTQDDDNLDRIEELIVQYIRDENIAIKDEEPLAGWLKQDNNTEFFETITNPGNLLEELKKFHAIEKTKPTAKNKIMEELFGASPVIALPTGRKRKSSNWLAIAASIVILFSLVGIWIYNSVKENPVTQTPRNETPAGQETVPATNYNNAILTLADGSTQILDNSNNIIREADGTVITNNNGMLDYTQKPTPDTGVHYNSLKTPHLSTYNITLSDSSIVNLNAGSHIRYPIAFKGAERVVEIEGEIYFAVAKNTGKPFRVKVNMPSGKAEEIEVLGTQFNINAYSDEPEIKTTLLTGEIKITVGKKTWNIKKGQQARLNKEGKIIVTNADMEASIQWKKNNFNFENQDIKSIMRQIARWYGVEVAFGNNLPTETFAGVLTRKQPIEEVIKSIEGIKNIHIAFDEKNTKKLIVTALNQVN